MIVCIILSSLALLAAVVNVVLFCVEKKRNNAVRTAMVQYIDNMNDGMEEFVKERLDSVNAEREKENVENAHFRKATNSTLTEMFEEIGKLKAGTVPDYEAAKAAANAVNDFNAGLSAIMNFDPIAVARARRQGGDKEAV